MIDKKLDGDDEELFPLTELVPTSQWIYNLYKVEFSEEENGKPFKTQFLVSTDDHVNYKCNERCGEMNRSTMIWYSWTIEKENVQHPKIAYHMDYGNGRRFAVYEDGWER